MKSKLAERTCFAHILTRKSRISLYLRKITIQKVSGHGTTNILEKTSPGINPASKGTNAVANDQTRTPTWRTFLQIDKGSIKRMGLMVKKISMISLLSSWKMGDFTSLWKKYQITFIRGMKETFWRINAIQSFCSQYRSIPHEKENNQIDYS